jgi:hypothetical protein
VAEGEGVVAEAEEEEQPGVVQASAAPVQPERARAVPRVEPARP